MERRTKQQNKESRKGYDSIKNLRVDELLNNTKNGKRKTKITRKIFHLVEDKHSLYTNI